MLAEIGVNNVINGLNGVNFDKSVNFAARLAENMGDPSSGERMHIARKQGGTHVPRTRSVLGLDIGTHSVRAVEVTGTADAFSVTGVGWERIPSPELLEETILAVIGNNNLRAKNVVTAVSGRSVIVRYVTMMSMPQEELRQAVRYEADKYIPYDVDDVQLDCQQLGGADGGQVRVLLVAAKKQLIEEHVALLKRVNLLPVIVDLDLFALSNAFEACNTRGALAHDGQAVALVDIGASKTSISIIKGSDDCFTREIYTAGNSMTDAIASRFGEEASDVELMKEDPGDALKAMMEAMTPVLEDVGNEVRLSFDYYENQFDHQVDKVYVSGGAIQFPGVVESLQSVFELETSRFNPFEYLDVMTHNDIIMREKASEMIIALGLASRIRGM